MGSAAPAATWKVHSALTLVQVGYAGANILSKFSFDSGLDPIVFSVFRDAVSLSCLLPMAYCFERARGPPPDWTTVALIALQGCIGMYIAQLTVTFGISLAPAVYACLIGITTPIFAFLISAVSGLEDIRLTSRGGQAKLLGVLSAVAGAVIIPFYTGPVIIPQIKSAHNIPLSELPLQHIQRGILSPTLGSLPIADWQLGGFLLILSGFLYAVYWTLQAYTLKRYPAPISVSALSYVSGTLFLLVTGLGTIHELSEWGKPFNASHITTILYVGLISSGMNFALQSWALVYAGPVLLAAYGPLQSFTTIALAYIFTGESIHLGSVLGLLCIVNGLFLITWGQIASRKEAGHPVKLLPSALDGVPIIKGDSSLHVNLLS